MFKFVVLYRRVDDEDALEAFFTDTHLPLVEALPGLRRLEISRITAQPLGRSRFYLEVEAYFDSEAAIAQWRMQDEHATARRRGRNEWYEHFEVRVARVERAYGKASGAASA